MLVKRSVEIEVNNGEYKVGDIITFKTAKRKFVQKAIAVKEENDGMIFCTINTLPSEYVMNNEKSNKGGYENSELRKKINTTIFNNYFSTAIKDMMVPFKNGDYLRLPTEKEIYGKNYNGECEDNTEQWDPMKDDYKMQLAFRGDSRFYAMYWLMNKTKYSVNNYNKTHFCMSGLVEPNYSPANEARDVRLVFKLEKNNKENVHC